MTPGKTKPICNVSVPISQASNNEIKVALYVENERGAPSCSPPPRLTARLGRKFLYFRTGRFHTLGGQDVGRFRQEANLSYSFKLFEDEEWLAARSAAADRLFNPQTVKGENSE